MLVEVFGQLQHFNEVPSISFTRHQECNMTEVQFSIIDAVLFLGQFVSQPFIVYRCCKFICLPTKKCNRNACERREIESWWFSLSILNLVHLRSVVILSKLFTYDILAEVVDTFERRSSWCMTHPLFDCCLADFEWIIISNNFHTYVDTTCDFKYTTHKTTRYTWLTEEFWSHGGKKVKTSLILFQSMDLIYSCVIYPCYWCKHNEQIYSLPEKLRVFMKG